MYWIALLHICTIPSVFLFSILYSEQIGVRLCTWAGIDKGSESSLERVQPSRGSLHRVRHLRARRDKMGQSGGFTLHYFTCVFIYHSPYFSGTAIHCIQVRHWA